MISQTRFARPAVMVGTAVALIAATSLALVLAARPPLRLPSPMTPRARAATEQMSSRALTQYRAFYTQQLVSEAALERWSLPEVSAQGHTTQQQRFYAEQMASESALERWSAALPGSVRSDLPIAPQPLTAGVQLK